MAGKFSFKKFSELDLSDSFFDSLKADYPGTEHSTGFEVWFEKKAADGSTVLVFHDDEGLGAFVYLKDEDEPVELENGILPAVNRMKIGTLKLAERYQGKRLGEGALGLALWQWRRKMSEEIYVTVFEKHEGIRAQVEKFGFALMGRNPNGELVYLKSRLHIDYSDPYKSFPFINPDFEYAGYMVVDDIYHDTLFPYSELKNTLQEQVGLNVANGISKIYIGSPTNIPPYKVGEPILVYRRFTGQGSKGHKSCITSYCVVSNIILAKENNQPKMSVDELIKRISNKSVFDEDEIRAKYVSERTLYIVEMLYYGYFGEGNNVNWVWLKQHNYWPEGYPTTARLTPAQFSELLREGNINVSNVIID
jgi:hypothetical protein